MPMFERENKIFANAEPLADSYEPEKLRERGEVLAKFQRALQPIVDNRPTSNIFLYGKTGTGKTVVTKYMLAHLQQDASQYDDVALSTLWVSCENLSSSYQVAVALVNELRETEGLDRISTTGHSQQEVFEMLYDHLDELGGTVAIVLDEIDNIGRSDDILYGLPRAQANGYVENSEPVVIGISNDFGFRENLSSKVRDTLAEKEILFPPYDANQLQSILQPRADKAYHEGVLTDDVVPLCAAYAAQDSGSARQAIRLLREAGELAQADGVESVSEEHVREAQEELERNQLHKGLEELTKQGHAVLCTLAYFTARGREPVRSRNLYEKYETVCEQASTETVSERRVRDHLADLAMLGLCTVHERNEGLSAGRYHEYELDVSLDVVLSALRTEAEFSEIAELIATKAANNDLLRADLEEFLAD